MHWLRIKRKLWPTLNKRMSGYLKICWFARKYGAMKYRKKERSISRLLNFENIKTKLFFEILKNQQYEKLNPKKIKISPAEEEKRWYQIYQQYLTTTDKKKYNSFVRELEFERKEEQKLVEIEALYILYKLLLTDNEKRKEYKTRLNNLGIIGNIDQGVKAYRTNYGLRKESKKVDKKKEAEQEEITFYERIGELKKIGISVDVDILLCEYCGIIAALKKENKPKNDKRTRNSKRD